MKGEIELRGDDVWRIRVLTGSGAGSRRYVSRTVHGGKRAAQRELTKLVVELDQGQLTAGHPGSVSELLDRWLADIAPLRSGYTMKEHRRSIDHDIRPAIGALRVDKLTARHLDHLYADLLARGLSPASVRRRHAVVHATLDRAVKWGVVAANAADRATPPGPIPTVVSAPAVDVVEQLISTAESGGNTVLATAVALAAVTGARRGELCALRWSDVDWSKRVLHIRHSLTVLRRVATVGPTKTHQRRVVSLDEALGALLAKRRADQEAFAAQVGIPMVADAYVLSRSADGSQPCLPDGLSLAYSRLVKSLGIRGHFHELRHFSATELIGKGVDVRTVAGRLGHADPSVTLRVYSHALEQRDRQAAELLGKAVLGAKPRQQLGAANGPPWWAKVVTEVPTKAHQRRDRL
ncbi:MAG: tyrosine-type recombinase/integrase [Acidimicrobiales bacterium]